MFKIRKITKNTVNHTASSSSVTHSTTLFFASMGLDFLFRDYFRLVTRCIVHACAWSNHTMSPAHIIGPKRQCGVGDIRAVAA